MSRHGYKSVWNELAETEERAKLHVGGSSDEAHLLATAYDTERTLEATVGIHLDDVILEIGCGVGRVGAVLAPLCRQWIGCDVSRRMLQYTAERLAGCPNVRLIELSGFDLKPVEDASVDVVYCTVVFMHLDEWDRFSYALEAHRTLRPGGRVYVDNFNLCSDEGWKVFEQHRAIPPNDRPPHISKSSTPQEIETYLRRAGFRSIQLQESGPWIRGWGVK